MNVRDGILGMCVGDAVGVPAEFQSRQALKKNPIKDMIGYGTHNQPPGTWSDDSSLAFCLAESLCNGYDIHDIAQKFCSWTFANYWTPYGKVFDIGRTTMDAIFRLKAAKVHPSEAGGADENSNGNGSLMRILPLAYYFKNKTIDIFPLIHEVSCLTHAHPRSQIACSIYIVMALELLDKIPLETAYLNTQQKIKKYYATKNEYKDELPHYVRILEQDISLLDETAISSRGYVVSTLEASIWTLMTTKNYKKAILKAINLGFDTDTTAAVVGGLAGILYGEENIPPHWIRKLARREDIFDLCGRLQKKLTVS